MPSLSRSTGVTLTILVIVYSRQFFVAADEVTTLYNALKKAFLTETNLFHLQNLFYPPEGTTISDFFIGICREDFRVLHIKEPSNTAGAFTVEHSLNYFIRRNIKCDFGNNVECRDIMNADGFLIYSAASKLPLAQYIWRFTRIWKMDITFFQIMTSLLGPASPIYYYENEQSMRTTNITLVIEELPSNPTEDDLRKALSMLMSWSRYYSRPSYSATESDQLAVVNDCYNRPSSIVDHYTISSMIHEVLLIIVVVTINLVLMIVSLYLIHQLLTTRSSNLFLTYLKLTKTGGNIIFWSSALVCLILNTACLIMEIVEILAFEWLNYIIFYVGLISFITLFEIIAIHIITMKNWPEFKLCTRIVWNYGICNIVWFIHRIGNCSIVSLYFIAFAPAQAVAAITLCSSFIVMLICSTAVALHICYSGYRNKKWFISTCKFFVLLILAICMITLVVSFTLIFVDLTQHGLTGSEMGSIILSLAIPFLTLLVGMVVKRQLKNSSLQGEERSDERVNLEESVTAELINN